MHSDPDPQQRPLEDAKQKQSNTLWPDAFRNSRSVDEFLWKGSPDAPLVQRIGACIFGLTFMLSGVGFVEIDREITPDRKSIVLVIVGVLFFGAGLKVFLNGFRRRKSRNTQDIH